MPKCQVRIEIPGDEGFVRPGSELDVIVHVSCDSTMPCDGLSLTRRWRTHGIGNPERGSQRTVELFRGTWEPGEYAYPAKVPFPPRPTSYHGKSINLDWYLKAQASVPAKGEGEAEIMLLVVDPAPPKPYTAPDHWAPKPVKLTTNTGASVILSMLAVPVAFFLIFGAGPGGKLLLIPLAILLFVAHKSLKGAATALGEAALDVHPKVIQPGEELHVMLEFRPEMDLRIEHVRLTLAAEEKAISGSGTNTVTYRERIFDLEEVFGKNISVSPTEHFAEEVKFRLPVTAPCTMVADDNVTKTVLSLQIKPEGKNSLRYVRDIHVGLPDATT